MVKINLIGKKRRQAGARNWVVVGLISIFTLFTVYFLGISIYVVTKLYLTKTAQDKVDAETVSISREMTSNSELLQRFVLSKFILSKIDSLNKEKFPYSEYLDQLTKFIPNEGVLKNVDFTTKGWVAVVASVPGGGSLKLLESNLSNSELVNESSFSNIFSEEINRERTGNYSAKLQFEINKNAGN